MYLKRMELQGFKSFADKTILEFKPGITSVIGPNGSGKSNISDAIRWVLGEQSMKSLRGAKSEDIIFAGTQARKSLGFAEVSIVIDNTDGKLPIEYTEVTVTRKLYRSGETGYFINKTPCRLKDILELFMDTGIGKDGYSIIGQGKIDEILSNKSEDRRHIFEEAAGIVKFRTRKQESEKKLEQTKLNLLRINDILAEIEANIEPLKLQADKARKFLDLREELKSIEVGLFVHHIQTYKEKLEQLLKDEETITSQREQEDSKMESLQNAKEDLRKVVDDITNQIEAMQNLGFESTNKIEKINSEIGITKERIQNNQNNQDNLKSKVKEEISYLDNNLISTLNIVNNLSYDNYKVSSKNIQSNKSDNNEKQNNSTEQESQPSGDLSQQGGKAESNSQNSGNSSQTQSIMTMEKNGVLTSRDKKTDWDLLKGLLEALYSSWSTIALDMNGLNINSEDILSFNTFLNDATKSVKDENKKDTMNNLLKLYALLPKYSSSVADDIFTNLLDTKVQVLNAYVLTEDKNWDEINKRLENAINEYGNIINNVEINTRNSAGVSQTYILLKELQRCTSVKDVDIFYINYKNFMQEIQGLE